MNQETLQQPLRNSDISKACHFNSIDEVILCICQHCQSGNINEAIAIANKCIAIYDEAEQIEIFKELFISAMNWIKNSVFPVEDNVISKSFEDIMKIFHRYKLFDSQLCSLIISECLGCDHTIKIGVKFFSFVQKIKVPVHSDAISSYIRTILSEEIPSLELVLFMEYVKWVCYLPCPKALLCKALRHFSKQEKTNLLGGFFRLCTFLCSVTSKELDKNALKNFIEFCIKNECWTQIASFCRAWCEDGHLITCLACSFLLRPKDTGMFYEKLTEEIYRDEEVSLYLVGILGQLGVYLMLEVSSKQLYDSAFQILFVLHKRNINYMELQACLYDPPSYLKSLPEFPDIFVFPFTVAFAALDICLHLKRFRDAYRIFKSYSLNLPEDMEDKLKLKVKSRRFRYLLKLVQELYSLEPLKLGLQAFHDLCLAAKDFSLEECENFTEEMQAIYNKYLAYVINASELDTALDIFQYSEGQLKAFFIVYPQVLRSLLVTFAQKDKMDEAYKFFSLGCKRKIYVLEQSKVEEHGWRLIIMSSWTFYEVKFLIKTFLENVSLALADLGMLLSVRILFEESKEDCLEIGFLKTSHSIDSAKEITCNVLKSLDANIKWVENQNPICLELVPETLCDYWIKTSPNFLWIKNSREKLLEHTRGKAGFKIQVSEEDFGYKYSAKSNITKSSNKVLGQLTPEYSVADSSYQLISDKICEPSEPLPETNHHESPEISTLESNLHHISNLYVLRSTEQEQIITSSNQLSPYVSNRSYPDFSSQSFPGVSSELSDVSSHSSSNASNQLSPDVSSQLSDVSSQLSPDVSIQLSLDVPKSPDVTSKLSPGVTSKLSPGVTSKLSPGVSNQLPPDVQASYTTTLDGKMSKIDASENISTRSGTTNQEIFENKLGNICNKMQLLDSSQQFTPSNSVPIALKRREKMKFNPIKGKKNYYLPISKKVVILPPENAQSAPEQSLSKTKHLFRRRPSKAWRAKNFQVTFKNSAEGEESRMVIPASPVKFAEPKNNKYDFKVPEAVFQKIVLFLQSKVLLKCRDLSPQQLGEKVNHLATLFIQSNNVGGLDKKTMKLLNEFVEHSV